MAKQLRYGSVEIYVDDILGVGSYGKVCKGKCGQLPCAVKLLHDTMFQHGDPGIHSFVRRFEQECQFLSSIKHPNIVQYLGTIANPESGRPVLLMELMDESLTKYLEQSSGPLPYYTQVDICHDVALALAYLHFNAIIHRDLSGNNVLLIGAGSRAKVTDFGMSKLVDINPHMTPLTQCPGTSAYMPPEALITPPNYSSKLDCFSLGVLAIQIVTRKFPNPGDAYTYIKDPKYPTGRLLMQFPEIDRRKKDIDLIEPNHSLLPITLHCIKDLDEERPSADELCEQLSSLKSKARYMHSKDQSNDQSSLVQRLQLEVETKKQEIQITIETKTKKLETAIQRITEEHKRELEQKTEELQQKAEEHKRELEEKEKIIQRLRDLKSETDGQHKEDEMEQSINVRAQNSEPKASDFEVLATYDYPGLERGDLPFIKGQKVVVFDDSREYWWRARDSRGNEGYIPANYVKRVGLDSEDWFFPNLSRTRTEHILKSEGRKGGFVVRNSSRENMYTLSICHDSQITHYLIKQDETQKYYVAEKHRFPSIKELIEYHKLNGGGLVTRLRRPPNQLAPKLATLSPLFDEAWEIDKSELTLGQELGSGQFGRVVAGKWRGKVDVAIKMMREGAMNEDDFIEEAMVMKEFQHENLVKLYGVCTRQGAIFIVQELLVYGCLLQYLRQRKELVERTEVILDMAIQIGSAMEYLEKSGFIHRDLAARKCLVGNRNVVKVADFGLARFVIDDEYTASVGTKFSNKWAAPEVITHAKFSSKSDVWSFGILLWELWTGGNTPYPMFTNSQVLDEVLVGYRLEIPKLCPLDIYDLMRKCWLPNAEDRPTFQSLCNSLQEQLYPNVEDY